jgi:hypothetical protein
MRGGSSGLGKGLPLRRAHDTNEDLRHMVSLPKLEISCVTLFSLIFHADLVLLVRVLCLYFASEGKFSDFSHGTPD